MTDRIPIEVLENGAVRWGIYNADGSLKEYVYLKREDGATVVGDPMNAGTFLKDATAALLGFDGSAVPDRILHKASLAVAAQTLSAEKTITSTADSTLKTGYYIPLMTSDTQGNFEASAVNYTASHNPFRAFDLETAAYWQSSTTGAGIWLQIKLDKPIKAVTFQLNGATGYIPITYNILGSNNGVDWTTLSTNSLTISSPGYYQYYRLVCNSAAYGAVQYQVSLFCMTSWYEPIYTYSAAFTAANAPDILDTGSILRVHTPSSYSESGVSVNTISVGAFGSKSLDVVLKGGKTYDLWYDGTGFNVFMDTVEVVHGTYTGNGGGISINLGFKPRLVFIRSVGSYSDSSRVSPFGIINPAGSNGVSGTSGYGGCQSGFAVLQNYGFDILSAYYSVWSYSGVVYSYTALR